jgi:hypothetical protein
VGRFLRNFGSNKSSKFKAVVGTIMVLLAGALVLWVILSIAGVGPWAM